jgi:hypothetical protein
MQNLVFAYFLSIEMATADSKCQFFGAIEELQYLQILQAYDWHALQNGIQLGPLLRYNPQVKSTK